MEDQVKIQFLLEKIKSGIRDGQDNIEDLLDTLDSSKDDLKEHGWSVISCLNDWLQEQDLAKRQIGVLLAFYKHMIDIGQPKELAYAFLESCNAFKNGTLYKLLVPLLAQVLCKLPPKQQSLDIACSTLLGHIKSLAWTSQTYSIAEDEAHPGLISSTGTTETDDMLIYVINFANNFLSTLAKEALCNDFIQNRRWITIYLAQVLHYPMLYIHYDNPSETLVHCVGSVIDSLAILSPTLTYLFTIEKAADQPAISFTTRKLIAQPIEEEMCSADMNESSVSLPGLANLAYILFYENKYEEHVPQIMSSAHKLSLVFPSLSHIYIRSRNSVVALKAIRLLRSLLSPIGVAELSESYAEQTIIKDTIDYLFWSMQYTDMMTIRQNAAKALPLLLSKFNHRARYHLFKYILDDEDSPEILSYTYSLIKDFIHECWSTGDNDKGAVYALDLMDKIFLVPNGDNGRLIADLDKISAALNLARYLTSRDKSRSAPYTRQMNRYIKSYVEPIGNCLHSELKQLKASLENLDKGSDRQSEITITVGDEALKNNEELERNTINSCINKIELVLFVHDCLTDSLNS